ncbi:MAG: D-alanyl-D-alanine carboxypeptidase [Chitinophagaceae bacterium]|nr:D-alanyl-D-alanine carboxypeptidase [Chitinophagaceae bacterium]MCW5904414.1 D-alanyl-D-alanine carboxypeptidase [Chitinophagaceae bacterium]
MINSNIFFRKQQFIFLFFFSTLLFFTKNISAQNISYRLQNYSIFSNAHVGIAIYEPATKKYWYDYQSKKYFIPASNMKIFTCYAAMKYLEDSITGLFYTEEDSNYIVRFSGDPTLLHPDFKQNPVIDFFKQNENITVIKSNWSNKYYGNGWAWNDYEAGYMPEVSAIPIYGNTVKFIREGNKITVMPQWFKDSLTIYGNTQFGKFSIGRDNFFNQFSLVDDNKKFTNTNIPFKTSEKLSIDLLQDTLLTLINYTDADIVGDVVWKKLKSQPTDTVLKLMMQRSDNFYAEHLLQLIGNDTMQAMKTNNIIAMLLKKLFAGIPDTPRWEDGSGLSRYNLVTPRDFVWVLTQMKNDISKERIEDIFPTGDKGTLSGYYTRYKGKIFAKTGTLSNNISLSGFITTKKGKELVFSILINNHRSSTTNIKKTIEKFLTDIINKN